MIVEDQENKVESMTNEPLKPQKASEWIVLLADQPASVAVQSDFQDWLEANAANRQDWDETLSTWRLLGMLEPSLDAQLAMLDAGDQKRAGSGQKLETFGFDSEDLTSSVKGMTPQRAVPLRTRKPGGWREGGMVRALGFMLVLLVAAFSWKEFRYLGADYSTASGEVSVLELADGSRVTLAPDSALNVVMLSDERYVEILAGGAYFEVSKDRSRPFVVDRDTVRTTVLGTAFLVDERNGNTSVSVTEGLVQVASLSGGAVPKQLKPGQTAMLSEADQFQVEQKNIDDVAAWRNGYLSVRDERLATVVEELDRFYGGYVFVRDRYVANKRLTGVFKLDDPRKSLKKIAELLQLEITELSPWIIVLSEK